jgi:hypothetical protein
MRGERGGHTADEDYIDFVYSMQRDTTRDYLKYLKPDGFYIVLKKEAGYKFMKFSPSGELLKRKVDKYVSFIKESTGNESEVDKIVDTMLDFIDEGERITFKSSTGEMTYTDYLEKNERYQKFKPVLVSKNKTVSKFSIVYSPKNASYDNLMVVLENMQSTIGRLGGDGWTLSGFEVNKVFNIFFEFTRPSIHHDKFELPDEDELRDSIINLGFSIDRLVIGDSEVELDYDNESWDYSGSRFSEETCEDKFGRICDIFGFGSFDLDYRRSKVIFEY